MLSIKINALGKPQKKSFFSCPATKRGFAASLTQIKLANSLHARTTYLELPTVMSTMVHKDTTDLCLVHTRPRPVKLKIYLRNPCGESVSEQGGGDNCYQGRPKDSQQSGGGARIPDEACTSSFCFPSITF